MTDFSDTNSDDDFDNEFDDALSAMLADPAVWAEASPASEDAIVSAIFAETDLSFADATAADDSSTDASAETKGEPEKLATVTSLDEVKDRTQRGWVRPFVAGVAAGLLLLAGFGVLRGVEFPDRDGAIEVALVGTDLAPDAMADVHVTETPIGTRLILDVSGLPPAEPGTYYEAWMRTGPEVGVSAGTFHLRGGDGEIELWSGVLGSDYPLITVTIQQEAEPTSSGVVVLKGRLP